MAAIGSGSQPTYVDGNGAVQASTVTLGTDTKPLKMVNGVLQAVSKELATKEELTTTNDRITIIEGVIGTLNVDSVSCHLAPEEDYFTGSGIYANMGGGYTADERHSESVTLTNGDVVSAVYYQHTSGTDTGKHYVGDDDNIEYQYKAARTDQIKFPVFSLTQASELISRYRASGSITYFIIADKGVWRYSQQQFLRHPDSSSTTGMIYLYGKLNVSYDSSGSVVTGSYDPTKVISKNNLAYKTTFIWDTKYGNERYYPLNCYGSVCLNFLNIGLKDPMPQEANQSELINCSGVLYVNSIWVFNTQYAFRNISELIFNQTYLPAKLCAPSGYTTPVVGASYMTPANADQLFLPTQIECGPTGITAKNIGLNDFGFIRVVCSLHSNSEYPTITASSSAVFSTMWSGTLGFAGCAGYPKRIDILVKASTQNRLFGYYPHSCNTWGLWNWVGAPCDVNTACNINFYSESVTYANSVELMDPQQWGAYPDQFIYNDGQERFTNWIKLNQKKFDATGETDCSSWPTLL